MFQAGSYLGDVGGVLGLWVGFSILTIFEFFELAMDMIILSIVRKCKCLKKPAQSGTGNTIIPTQPKGVKGAATGGPIPLPEKPAKSKQSLLSGYHSAIVPPPDGAVPPPANEKSKDFDPGYMFPPAENKEKKNGLPPPQYEMTSGRHRTPPPPYSSRGNSSTSNRPLPKPFKPASPVTPADDGVDILLNL